MHFSSSGTWRSQRGPGGLGPPPRKGVEKNLQNRFSSAKGTNINVKVLWLVIENVNVTKYVPQKCQMTDWSSGVFFKL